MTGAVAGVRMAEFLDAVAGREATPGAGGVAAVSVGLAAGLVSMVARFSTETEPADTGRGAAAVLSQAEALRARMLPLADADARAYTSVLEAYALPRQPDPGARRRRIEAALSGAADVPLELSEVAAAVAQLAAEMAGSGNHNLRGDAVTAALLAAAAARSAAGLVALNLPGGTDERVRRAADLAGHAGAAADAALATMRSGDPL